MPHGDFSDYGAAFSAVSGLSLIWAPEAVATFSAGPLLPMFDSPNEQTVLALRFAGGLFMYLAFTLFVVRWNNINGKAGALGCFFVTVNSGRTAWKMDGGEFKPRMWYVVSLFYLLVAAHLAFNANPPLTSAELKKKEDAAKAKSK